MFRFENGSVLQSLILIPLLWVLAWVFSKRHKKKWSEILGERNRQMLIRNVSENKRRWKQILQGLAVVLMLIAWARPQQGQSQEKIKSEGIEILFVVDVSESMLTEDVKPSRLEQVKAELSRLMDLSPGNKVGVIAFAGSAALLCPLTNDPGAVKMYLDSLSPSSVSSQGTNFQQALDLAKEGFERGGVSTDETTKATRVILVASDGEDHEEGALKAAEQLTQQGIKIFTLAYGTEKGGAIPARDNMGYLRGYKKDRQGQTILSTVKGDFLRKLAEQGKGSFHFAVFGGEHVKNLVEEFSQLEKTLFDSQVATQYEEKFQIFLLFAFFIALLELFLGEKRTRFRLWKGRFEVSES